MGAEDDKDCIVHYKVYFMASGKLALSKKIKAGRLLCDITLKVKGLNPIL